MNPWTPARDQASAERLYRITSKHGLAGLTLAAMVNKGWTLATMIEHGYAEAVPAMPMMPGMPGPVVPPPDAPLWPASPHEDEWHITRPLKPSDIAASVVDQVLDRDAHGQRKYGVSLDRTDLDTPDWLQHMAEELLDGAHYALAAKREIERREHAQRQAVTDCMNTTQDQAKALLSPDEYRIAERVLGVFWRLYQSNLSK